MRRFIWEVDPVLWWTLKEIKEEVMTKQFGLNKDYDDEAISDAADGGSKQKPERKRLHDQGSKTEESGESKNEANEESKEARGDPADLQ